LPLVSIRNVWKIFGSTVALRDVEAELEVGEVMLLLGPNGSGKSTLIKIIGGMLRPDRGSALILGRDAWRLSLKRRGFIGVALEDFHVPWWASARRFLRHVARIKDARWEDVESLARRLGVTEYWDSLALKYSSGMLKKVGLLQALIGRPKLLLLDEPLTLLDAHSRRVFTEILGEMKGEVGIVIASHLVFGLEKLVDKVVVLENGAVRAVGRAESIALSHGAAGVKCRVEEGLPSLEALSRQVGELRIREGEVVLYMVPQLLAEELLKTGLCERFVDLEELYRGILESGGKPSQAS